MYYGRLRILDFCVLRTLRSTRTYEYIVQRDKYVLRVFHLLGVFHSHSCALSVRRS
jgi:hypothetical protein